MIYDFKEADEAMEKLKVDPIQFHFLFLLYHRADGLSSSSQLERFRDQVLDNEPPEVMRNRIDRLESLGLLENLSVIKGNKETKKYNTDYLIPTSKFIDTVILQEAGEELWNNYPAAMGLGQGGHFMSRIGDKDEICDAYAKKIKKDVKKHRFVMDMLEVFKHMEKNNQITGMGITKFVSSEAWDSINEIQQQGISVLGNHSSSIGS